MNLLQESGIGLVSLHCKKETFKSEKKQETSLWFLKLTTSAKKFDIFSRFKFEWLYKETTMEATRLLMWIFKRSPWKRPSLEEAQAHRWLNPVDYMAKKRERAYFPSNRIQKFAREYHRSRPQMDLDGASFFSKLV